MANAGDGGQDADGMLENGDEGRMSLYERAVYQLNCLQSNAMTIAKNQANRQQMAMVNVQETRECLQKLGLSLDDLDTLNVVHITGTKGKGSTAAFLEAILRSLGYKTGFYSSPHLVHARERIRINGRPISEEYFAEQFFPIYDTLNATRQQGQSMPAYFKFLTLLAFRCFCHQSVDVAIVEVGIGGEYDCTNVVRTPLACAITTLDLDHTKLLGNTIPEIAWHKAGIAKPGSTLLTVEQPPEAMEVIKRRCQERKCSLHVVPSTLTAYGWPNAGEIKIGIAGIHHHPNVSMALQLARVWLHKMQQKQQRKDDCALNDWCWWHEPEPEQKASAEGQPPHLLDGFMVPAKIAAALAECRWPGRSQLFQRGNIVFHLDGAHTPQSIKFCADWFRQSSLGDDRCCLRVLLFHCTGDRDPSLLLPRLVAGCHFNLALFCPARMDAQPAPMLSRDNTSLNIDPGADMRRCEQDKAIWMSLLEEERRSRTGPDGEQQQQAKEAAPDNCADASIFPSISDALVYIEQLAANNNTRRISDDGNGGGDRQQMHVLVTGSFHLVGGLLALLDPGGETTI